MSRFIRSAFDLNAFHFVPASPHVGRKGEREITILSALLYSSTIKRRLLHTTIKLVTFLRLHVDCASFLRSARRGIDEASLPFNNVNLCKRNRRLIHPRRVIIPEFFFPLFFLSPSLSISLLSRYLSPSPSLFPQFMSGNRVTVSKRSGLAFDTSACGWRWR